MFNTKLRTLVIFGLLLLVGGLGVNCVPKEAEMGFEEFQAFDLQQLHTLQVKLTYVGKQTEPIPTVAFTSSFNTVDMEKFKPFRRSGFHYGNDDIPDIWTFACSPEELKRIIDAVGEIEAVRQGKVVGEFLSFMMYNTTPAGDKAFEAILDAETSKLLLSKIRAALDTGNTEGIATLDGLAQVLLLSD
jgi:hypothetical protein